MVLSELATALLEEDGIESVLDFIADRMATRASAESSPPLSDGGSRPIHGCLCSMVLTKFRPQVIALSFSAAIRV